MEQLLKFFMSNKFFVSIKYGNVEIGICVSQKAPETSSYILQNYNLTIFFHLVCNKVWTSCFVAHLSNNPLAKVSHFSAISVYSFVKSYKMFRYIASFIEFSPEGYPDDQFLITCIFEAYLLAILAYSNAFFKGSSHWMLWENSKATMLYKGLALIIK